MVLSSQKIRAACNSFLEKPLLSPFRERRKFEGCSQGLSTCGYDIGLDEIMVSGDDGIQYLNNIENNMIRTLWENKFQTKNLDGWSIAAGTFVLASAQEKFCMPKNLVGRVHDKSTWARRGLTVQNTIIEPGWEGYLTLELVNHSKEAIFVPRGVGIAQVIFELLDEDTDQPYTGKYQNQKRGPVAAISEKQDGEENEQKT